MPHKELEWALPWHWGAPARSGRHQPASFASGDDWFSAGRTAAPQGACGELRAPVQWEMAVRTAG